MTKYRALTRLAPMVVGFLLVLAATPALGQQDEVWPVSELVEPEYDDLFVCTNGSTVNVTVSPYFYVMVNQGDVNDIIVFVGDELWDVIGYNGSVSPDVEFPVETDGQGNGASDWDYPSAVVSVVSVPSTGTTYRYARAHLSLTDDQGLTQVYDLRTKEVRIRVYKE
jgi:hypothetical protein